MYHIHCLNTISPKGTRLFSENYTFTDRIMEANAVLVRSANMHTVSFPDSLLAVSRAGAGVNNIPIPLCTESGIVVFNTPGANANAVVELAICGLLLGNRDILGGVEWVKKLTHSSSIANEVEKEKGRFAGQEIAGRSLGVIGLGAIGGSLANHAIRLGMDVYGYDPYLSIDGAWHLDSQITHMKELKELYERCDYISLHTPLVESTKGMLGMEAFSQMKNGAVLLNFARDALVDDLALTAALQCGKLKCYITDFPNDITAKLPGVIAIPHLGASTQESEDNCARMAVHQVMDYLENGNIVNSVNFPNCSMGKCTKAARILILHRNIPNSLGSFTSAVASEGINISDLLNRSKDEYACTMLDLDSRVSERVLTNIRSVDGVLRVRLL